MTLAIDPMAYYGAARQCVELARDVETPARRLRATLSQCGGMAGHYDAVKVWAGTYDARTKELVQTADTFVAALLNFGNILNTVGHNWAIANWRANRDPGKGAAPEKPKLESSPTIGPFAYIPSSGTNGPGMETNVPGLLDQVGCQIPDGHTDKLQTAKDAWDKFADDPSVTGAVAKIQSITVLFEHVQAPEVAYVRDHLATLRQGADGIAQTSAAIALPVGTHYQALGTVRSDVDNSLSHLKKTLALTVTVTVIAVVVTTALTLGLGAAGPDEVEVAAGAATAGTLLGEAALAIRSAIIGSALIALFTETANAGWPDPVQGFQKAALALAAIAAMTVKSLDGDDESEGTGGGAGTGTANASNTPGTPEYAKRVDELAQDPAHGGKVSDKSRREAEVALGMEHDGQLTGPVTRAPMVDGQDTGDFVDGAGKHWDMKQPTDTFPPAAGNMAGQPMPPTMRGAYNEQDFEKMVGDELGTGENVMIDRQNLSEAGLKSVQQVIAKHPEWAGKVQIYNR